MPDYAIPTNAELREIEQDFLPRLIADRPIFKYMPITTVEADLLIWEQQGNYIGVQQYRGLGGAPSRVQNVGGKRYVAEPGVYGDFRELDEAELTRRRMYGNFGKAADISDMVRKAQDQLIQRELDLIEKIGWTLFTTGTYSVLDRNGNVMQTDSYSLQTFTAATTWATVATATPIADLRALKLKARGHSVRFDKTASLIVNQTTVNNMLNNTNANDIGGKRKIFGGNILSLEDANKIFADNDLPTIVVNDDGYYNDSNTFATFIADNVGVLVGQRTSGVPVANYMMTRNGENPDCAPGPYIKVIDTGATKVPRTIEVHRGHNGGPTVEFPYGIVQCTF